MSLNPILTQKMVDLQNSVTRLLIIVFIELFSAFRRSVPFELLV